MKQHVHCKTMDGIANYQRGSGACQLVFTDEDTLTISSGSCQLGALVQGYEGCEPKAGRAASKALPFAGHDLIYTVDEIGCLAQFWSRDMWSEEVNLRGWPDLKPGEEADVYCGTGKDGITVYRGIVQTVAPCGQRYMLTFVDGARAGVCHKFALYAIETSCDPDYTHELAGQDLVYSRSGDLNEVAFVMPYSAWCICGGQEFEPGTALDLPEGELSDLADHVRLRRAVIEGYTAPAGSSVGRFTLSNGQEIQLLSGFEHRSFMHALDLEGQPLEEAIGLDIYYFANPDSPIRATLVRAEEWPALSNADIPLNGDALVPKSVFACFEDTDEEAPG